MKLYILHGSATGNAEQMAKDLAEEAKATKTDDDEEIICEKLDTFRRYQPDWSSSPSDPKKQHGLIVICSTTGSGDAPENASRFFRFIKRKMTSPTAFQNVCYGVLGLGDTNYDQFCQAAEVIDSKLSEKGGSRIQSLTKADEAVGLESGVEPFLETILQTIRNGMKGIANEVVTTKNTENDTKEEKKVTSTTEEEKKEDSSPAVVTSAVTATIPKPLATTSASSSSSPLFILYGSATGNAEFIAKDLAAAYNGKYFQKDQIVCAPLNSYKSKKALSIWESAPPPSGKHGLLVVCSTTGNGDVPDNGERFTRWLGRKSTPENVLENIAYAVLALGDTNYDQFCQAGVILDSKMASKGGKRVIPLAMADEGTGLEDVVEPWKQCIFFELEQACRGSGGATTTTKKEETKEEEKQSDEASTPPPSVVTAKSSTIGSRPALPVTNSTNKSKPALPTTNSTNKSKPALPVTNSTNRSKPALPVTNSTNRSKPAIPAVSSTNRSKPSIPAVSSTNRSKPSIPAVSSTNRSKPALPTTKNPVTSNSVGVAILCRALWQRKEKSNEQNMKSSKLMSTAELLPLVLPSSTKAVNRKTEKPTLLRSCQVINIDDISNDNEKKNTATSLLEVATNHQEWECQTASSMSSSGIMYTHSNPYFSSVTKARYLTNTSTSAAEEANKLQSSTSPADPDNNSSSSFSQRGKLVDEMMNIYDQQFPLEEDSTKDVDAAKAERNGKRVLELTLRLPDDFSLSYEPGDSLGLMVPNPQSQVLEFWNLLQQNQKNPTTTPLQATFVSIEKQKPTTLEYLLTNVLDLSSPFTNKNIVRRILLQLLSLLLQDDNSSVPSEDEKQQIQALEKLVHHQNGKDETDLLEELLIQPRWTIVDLIQSFPVLASLISLQQWIEIVLPKLPPRYYSVSSSPLVQSLELTIAFSVVDYNMSMSQYDDTTTKIQQRRRKGGIATRYLEAIASPWLASDVSNTAVTDESASPCKHSFLLPIFPKPSSEFRLPASLSTPLILIGPGTGIAPFLGFMQHRRAQLLEKVSAKHNLEEGTWRGSFEIENQTSPSSDNLPSVANSPIVDVYFGCRHEDHDFLYQSELKSYQKEGYIRNLHTAFSRSSSQKKEYVQDKMICSEEETDLVQLILRHNASVYVCGDGNHMGKDVQAKIVKLLSSQPSQDDNTAQAYLEQMKRDQRFVMDIWS